MATSTTRTNKPILPRGNDQSPKGYNRAALYSGKALDFDGVNDSVTISDNAAVDFGTSDFSIAFIMQSDTAGYGRLIDKRSGTSGYTLSVGTSKELVLELNNGAGSAGFFTSSVYADGKLKHVVISADRDGNASFYINGVLDETIDISSKAGNLDSTSDLFIGADAPSGVGLYYNGQIAGVKMYSTALTAAQVADLYNNPEKVVPTGVDNTALKLWLPMMEGAGTYCINGADPLGADEFGGAGSFDSATGWTLNTGCSIGGGKLSIDGTQTANTSAYYNISSVASSLVMVQFTLSNVTAGQVQLAFFGASGTTTKWYTANGTYTEYVEVAAGHNGNTGFITNADFVGDIDDLTLKVVNTGAISGATWTHGVGAPVAQTAVIDWNKETTGAGTTMLLPQGLTSGRDITGVNLFENVRKQGALNLDGNSWAEVHDNASLDFGTGEFTMECWVNGAFVNAGSSFNGILTLGGDAATSASSSAGIYSRAANYYFAINLNGINFSTIDLDTWTHLVVTRNSSNLISTYYNGALDTTATYADSITNALNPQIGRDSNSSRFYQDQIAQPRIYNRALTAEEVQRNYNAGKNTYTN